MPGAITITEFYYEHRVSLRAVVTWTPGPFSPEDVCEVEMAGDFSPTESWLDRNAGVAFVKVTRGEGSSLRIDTWGTDTNGDYSAEAIDIFTLPINLDGAFPPDYDGLVVDSRIDSSWHYRISKLQNNPNGFCLTAGIPAPPVPLVP